MRKVVRDWEFADSVKLEQRRVAVLPGHEVLEEGEQYSDGDMTKVYNNVEFVSIYRVEENNVSKLTKDQFNKLSESEQIDYINELGNFYCDCDLVEKADVSVIDLDSDTEIENLFDYLLDLNAEGTDLQGHCFIEIEVYSEGIEEVCGSLMLMCRVVDHGGIFTMVGEHVNVLLDEQLDCDSNIIHNEDRFDEDAKIEILAQLKKIVRFELLNYYIDKSGLKVNFLIEKLGINRTTYYRKIENDFNFSRSELMIIKEVLHLTYEDFLKLF